MATGWERLGQSLAAVSPGAREARREQMLSDMIARGRQDQAFRQDMMKTGALDTGLGNELAGFGYTPEQARAAVMSARAGIDPRQFTGARGDLQGQQFRQDAVDAARLGDWALGNANMLGVANGPVDLAKIQGDTLLGNVLVPGGDVRGPTDVGQATIAQRHASAGASNAQAQAALGRLGIAQQQFALQRAGQWNPSGGAGGGASGAKPTPQSRESLADQFGLTGDARTRYVLTGSLPANASLSGGGDQMDISSTFNPRQRAGAAMQREALLNQVAAQTGTPPTEVQRIFQTQGPEGVGELMRSKGRRFFQGPILGEIPFLSERINRDITPFGEGAARGQAMINDPSGPITGPDVEGARAMVPSIRQPIGVQANLVETMLRMSGGGGDGGASAPSLGDVVGTGPARVQSAAEYNALPSGAVYITPDGTQRRKP